MLMNALTHHCKNIFIKQLRQPLLAGVIFVSRLGWLPANLSPLGSFGFFGQNVPLFLATIITFDLLIGGLYPGFLFTYLGFLVYPVLGYLARKQLKAQIILLPLASALFFLLSNAGVWWYWYPHTLESLIVCYTLALPFYTRTLLGDLGFGYGYMLVRHFYRLIQRSDEQLQIKTVSKA